MSRQDSKSHYRNLDDEESKEPRESPRQVHHKSKMWILYACIATVCFALSAYILGLLSVGGVAAKFLNSYGYFIIGSGIALAKNLRFSFERHQHFQRNPEERKVKSLYASLKDSCYFDREKEEYKHLCLFLSFICGLFNLAGEFCVVLAFKHALDAYMNQGILSAIFTFGAIAVLLGSVFLLKEHVKICEYFGMALVIAGVIVLSLSKKQSDVDLGGLEPIVEKFANYLPIEGPETAIAFMVAGSLCFGIRGVILKYMGIVHGIDGISASSIFLMTDGVIGGIIGIIMTVNGGGYASFPAKNIVLGICSGCLAGTGVVFINKAIMEGVAGPAVAVANLSSVIQALL